MLQLTEEHLTAIAEHGARDYPYECCGLLLGRFDEAGRKVVAETFPLDNAREAEARHNRSLITPDDLLRGERYAREKNLDVVGNYHSHPDCPAEPSQFDLEHAWPTWSYVIVSVRAQRAVALRSWELEADRTKFNEEDIIKGERAWQ